jgi:dihydroflavonol-4-reductase
MRVFITGGTGFIGSYVVMRLAQTDHTMYCLVRKQEQAPYLEKHGATCVVGDVTDRESVARGMEGCDWVINLANLYSFWEPDKRIYWEVNVEGTRNVLECALECGVSKVLHVSTCGIYGKPDDSPFTEESPVGPERFSEYFRTKYEGDLIAWDMYEKKGLPLVMVYPVAVLGGCDPKATGKYINDLINRRLPATVFLDSVLTFVHVRDVAEIILRAAEKEGNLGEKYIAGKSEMSLRELNGMVREISGVPLPILSLPDFMVTLNARLLTWLSSVTKKSPIWGMSVDQMRTMKEGFRINGSKAERELGITYTPIRAALEEAISSFRDDPQETV